MTALKAPVRTGQSKARAGKQRNITQPKTNERWNPEAVKDALIGAYGSVSGACVILKKASGQSPSRTTIYEAIKRHGWQPMIDELNKELVDRAGYTLTRLLNSKDGNVALRAAMEILDRRGKTFGWSKRSEFDVTTHDDTELEKARAIVQTMSKEERLAELNRMREKDTNEHQAPS